jgi:hypothetical protein
LAIPLTSGRPWERIANADVPTATNKGYQVWDADDHDVRGYFKYPDLSKPNKSSLYSLGIERVAFVLAQKLDLPVAEIYLEDVGGETGIVSTKVPGNLWSAIDEDQFNHVTLADSDRYTLYLAFDVLVANHDRHDGNIFVEWNAPLRRRPVEGEQCALWLIDYGWSGLWPVYKFGKNLGAADLENMSPSADLEREFVQAIFYNTPVQIRQRVALRGSDERREALEILRGITDDDIEAAVDDVRGTYMTERAAEITSEFLRGRLARVDTLMDVVFPL